MTPFVVKSAADQAVEHILRRMRDNPRLAYFICPATEAFALLTEAASQASGEPVESLRQRLDRELTYEGNDTSADEAPIDEATFQECGSRGTRITFLFDNELLARVALVGGGDAFKDEMHANIVLAHLLRLGLERMEAQLSSEQEELF